MSAILWLVAVATADKQVASELRLSEEMIKEHMKNHFAKLGVADRTHAVTLAARWGAASSSLELRFAEPLATRTGAYRPVAVIVSCEELPRHTLDDEPWVAFEVFVLIKSPQLGLYACT